MKCVKIDLPESLENVKIEIFSDLHMSSPKCDYKLIQERIERVKRNENTYAVLLGDLINNSTKTSVGDTFEDELSPMESMKLAIATFEPIKDKIIGIVSGNHEARSYKNDGVDLTWFLAKELNLIDRYDFTACLLFVRFGLAENYKSKKRQNCYSIYMTHGSGQGGRTVGGKANGLQRRGQIVNASVVITGHTHMPISFRDAFYEIDYKNSSVALKEQLFVNASSTLNYESYAENFGMKPSSKQSPIILLHGNGKKLAEVIM